jgi:hypothetical protein
MNRTRDTVAEDHVPRQTLLLETTQQQLSRKPEQTCEASQVSSILPMSRSMRWGKQIGGANKTTAALSEPPLTPRP